MEASRGRPDADLSRRLAEEPGAFEFFQAVRLLENAATRDAPPRAPVGHDHPPAEESIRFHASPALAFPAAPIQALERFAASSEDLPSASPWHMHVTFLGLVGAAGVLPAHYSELVHERARKRDTAFRDFLDLFHHRAISFFYRAWCKYRFPIAWERERARGNADAFTWIVECLAGRGTPGLQRRQALRDETAVYFAGHLAHRPRNAAALESMLADFLGVDVRVDQFVGRWLTVPEEERTRLCATGGARALSNNVLGAGVLVGERVWDVGSKIRIHLGPLTADQFERLEPGSSGVQRLRDLVFAYLDLGTDAELSVELAPGCAPALRVDSRDDRTARLGCDAWLSAHPAKASPSPAVISLDCG